MKKLSTASPCSPVGLVDPVTTSLLPLQVLVEVARSLGVKCHVRGTMLSIEGPRFSSRAESLMFRQWGADVINMTTVPEVVLAKEAGLCYASIAMATDYDCWMEHEEAVSGGLECNLQNEVTLFQNVTRCRCNAIPIFFFCHSQLVLFYGLPVLDKGFCRLCSVSRREYCGFFWFPISLPYVRRSFIMIYSAWAS